MSLSDALALRARLEIADGEFDDALRTIQTGYALSRHIGSEGTIIVGLIGSLIESKATDQLTALIASPGAPNLYWAIVDLPKPLIDVRRMFEVESEYIYRLLPQLSDAKTKELPEQTWDEMLVAVLEKLNESPVLPDGDEDESDKSLRESNIRAKAGQAREDLIALGRGKDEVAAMCDSRAILLHAALTYESWRDELFKAVNLPYVDARRIVEQTTKRAEKEAAKSEIIPLASTALPIMVGTLPPIARNHRKLEMLRIIEALRAFAAENEGKFPKSLDEIKDLPIPTNPMTGKPFGYRIEGDRAILEAVDEHDFRPVRYLLRSANSAE
jgi:hypothetical protein